MQGSFEDIYNRLYPSLSQDIFHNIHNDYEIITSSDSTEDEFTLINNIIDEQDECITKNKIIMFDIYQYLDKIAKSLGSIEKTRDQFNLDFHRSELYLNKKYIRGKDYFINYVNTNFNYLTNMMMFDNILMSDLILMICNQAGLAFSFMLMNKLFSNYDKGIYVTSNNIKYFIDGKQKDNLVIEVVGIFNIKNVNTNKIKGSITVNTKFDIMFDKGNRDSCKYIFPKLGIVYWSNSMIK